MTFQWKDRSGRPVERRFPNAVVRLADGRPAWMRKRVWVRPEVRAIKYPELGELHE